MRRAAAEAAFDAAWQRHMVLWSDGVASGARDVAGWALATLGARPAPQACRKVRAGEVVTLDDLEPPPDNQAWKVRAQMLKIFA